MGIQVLRLLYGPRGAGKSTKIQRLNESEELSALDLEIFNDLEEQRNAFRAYVEYVRKHKELTYRTIGMGGVEVMEARKLCEILPKRIVVQHELLLPPTSVYYPRLELRDSFYPEKYSRVDNYSEFATRADEYDCINED